MYRERLITTGRDASYWSFDVANRWPSDPVGLTVEAPLCRLYACEGAPYELATLARKVLASGGQALLCEASTRSILVATVPLPLPQRGSRKQTGAGDGLRLLSEACRLLDSTRVVLWLSRGWAKTTGTVVPITPADGPTGNTK